MSAYNGGDQGVADYGVSHLGNPTALWINMPAPSPRRVGSSTVRVELMLMAVAAMSMLWLYGMRPSPDASGDQYLVLRGSLQRIDENKIRGTKNVESASQRPCPPCPSSVKSHDRKPPATHVVRSSRRTWNETVRCAFVTLLRECRDSTRYAGFIESTHRIRRTFKLEQQYPHVVFYEGGFPKEHREAIVAAAPWVLFNNISHVWGNDKDRPPVEAWNATDRSEGYKNMCRFYGLQIFAVSRRLGFDVVMRVDDDVFMLRAVDYDPFRVVWESGAVYAWGSVTKESHFHTELTFEPFVRAYCDELEAAAGDDDKDVSPRGDQVGRRDCIALSKSVIERMYFNNVFATVVDFWSQVPVTRFLNRLDDSHGIYVHRWGDAPIQTAAIRLFSKFEYGYESGSARQLPRLHYVHFSTNNLIVDGAVSCLACNGALTYFSGLMSSSNADSTRQQLGNSVVTIDEVVEGIMGVHHTAFISDLLSIGIWHDWGLGSTLDDLPVFSFLQLVEKVGVFCENIGFINIHILLPLHCCCHLDVFRTDVTVQTAMTITVYNILEPWMKSALTRSMHFKADANWLSTFKKGADVQGAREGPLKERRNEHVRLPLSH